MCGTDVRVVVRVVTKSNKFNRRVRKNIKSLKTLDYLTVTERMTEVYSAKAEVKMTLRVLSNLARAIYIYVGSKMMEALGPYRL